MADTDVQGMLVRIEATTAQLRLEMANADRVVDRSSAGINRNLLTIDRAFDKTGQAAQHAGVLMKGAFAALAGAGLVGTIIKQADEYGQMADRMRMATGSSQEYQDVQQHLLQTAQETYRPLHEAQELYIRTANVMKDLGFNTQETLDITDSFSFLLVTNAASADKASGALGAYSKSLQTGKVDADSWIAIQTAMPTVVKAIADATGLAEKEIRDLGVTGKLALSNLNKGFLDTVVVNRKAALDMSTSVADALNNIGNAFQDLVGRANETTSATGILAQGLGLLAKHLEPTLIVVAAGAFGAFAGSMIKSSLALIDSTRGMLAQRGAAIASARAAVAAAESQAIYARSLLAGAEAAVAASVGMARLSLVQSELIPKQVAARVATDALTAAQERLDKAAKIGSMRGLLGLLGGPVGLAVTLGLTATAFLAMGSGADKAGVSIDDLQKPVSQLREEFAKLNKDQREASLVKWQQEQINATDKVKDAYGDLAKSIRSAVVTAPARDSNGQYNRQLAEYQGLIDRLNEARASGQGLSPVLREVATRLQLPAATIQQWITQAGAVSDADQRTGLIAETLRVLTGVTEQNTSSTQANNAAKSGMSTAGQTYLETLQKQLAGLQDNGDQLKVANRYIAEHAELTETDRLAILSAANAIEAQKKSTEQANKAKRKGASEGESAAKQQLKSFDTAEEGYKRQIELINTTGNKQHEATEVMKLSFELQEGKLGKLNEAQKKKLQGMAAELDALNKLKKANEDDLKLTAFKNAQTLNTQTTKDGFDQELAGVGMGDKARDRMRADLAMRQKYVADVAALNEQRNTGQISPELYVNETQVLQEELNKRLLAQENFYAATDEQQVNWMNGVNEAWANYADAARDYSAQATDITNTALSEATGGLGTFFSDVASGAEDAGDALGDMVGNFAKSMLKALGDMAAQWLIYQGIQMLVGKTTQASAAGTLGANAQAMSLTAGLNAYASTAAIPIIGPAAAPAAMATAMSVTAPLASAVGMTALAGMAHDGIESVPEDGSWFLQKGERVTTAQTSAKLDAMLSKIDSGLNNAQPQAQIGAGVLEAMSDGRPGMVGSGGGGAAPGGPTQIVYSPQVTVQAQPGMSDQDARRQGEMIGAGQETQFRGFLQREMGQGGLLWKR